MPTQHSLLGFHGLDMDAAREYGDRLESICLSEKCQLLEAIGAWTCLCAITNERDWPSFVEFADEYNSFPGCPDVEAMVKAYFDYADPEAIIDLAIAVAYQIKEGCYLQLEDTDLEDVAA